jgi:hypothetical protein
MTGRAVVFLIEELPVATDLREWPLIGFNIRSRRINERRVSRKKR